MGSRLPKRNLRLPCVSAVVCPAIGLARRSRRYVGPGNPAHVAGLSPARAALLRQFAPSWYEPSELSGIREQELIFRAWKRDARGQKIWAKNYGLRAWPIHVPRQ